MTFPFCVADCGGFAMRRAAMMDDDMEDSAGVEDKDGGSNRSMPSSCGQPICSSSGAARVAKNLISFLLVIGASGSHEETFLLTCKVLARLIGASQNGLRLGHIAHCTLPHMTNNTFTPGGQPSQLKHKMKMGQCASRAAGLRIVESGSPGENSHHGRGGDWTADFESSVASDGTGPKPAANGQRIFAIRRVGRPNVRRNCHTKSTFDSDPLQFHQRTRIGALHPR